MLSHLCFFSFSFHVTVLFRDALFCLHFIFSILPQKAIAFLSQMSYKLAFKLLSQRSDCYLNFVLNLTSVNVLFLFFFSPLFFFKAW